MFRHAAFLHSSYVLYHLVPPATSCWRSLGGWNFPIWTGLPLLGHWVRSTHHNCKCWLAHMNLENKRFFVSDLFFLICISMNINVFVLCFITFFNVFDTLYVQPLLKCYKIGQLHVCSKIISIYLFQGFFEEGSRFHRWSLAPLDANFLPCTRPGKYVDSNNNNFIG